MVSLITMRSGFRTNLTVVLLGSSISSLTSSMLSFRISRLSRTSFDGSGTSIIFPTVALARPMNLLITPKTLSIYQLVMSGKLRSLRVSPVGAVSMTMTSYLPSFSNLFT